MSGNRLVILQDIRSDSAGQARVEELGAALQEAIPVFILPAKLDEAACLRYLETNPASLLLLPWSRYCQWKALRANASCAMLSYATSPLQDHEMEDIETSKGIQILPLCYNSSIPIAVGWTQNRILGKLAGLAPLFNSHEVHKKKDVWDVQTRIGEVTDSVEDWIRSQYPSLHILIPQIRRLMGEIGCALSNDLLISSQQTSVLLFFEANQFWITLQFSSALPITELHSKLVNSPSRAARTAQALATFAHFLTLSSHSGTQEHLLSIGLSANSPALFQERGLSAVWFETTESALSVDLNFPGASPWRSSTQNAAQLDPKIQSLLFKLRSELDAKEKLLIQMRSGGIGAQSSSKMPEGDILIEAMSHRFSKLKQQIQILEKAESLEPSTLQAERLAELKKTQIRWIKAMIKILNPERREAA